MTVSRSIQSSIPTNEAKCRDCGLRLDRFGVCPLADPKEAARMTSPVYCDLSPLESGRRMRIALDFIVEPAIEKARTA